MNKRNNKRFVFFSMLLEPGRVITRVPFKRVVDYPKHSRYLVEDPELQLIVPKAILNDENNESLEPENNKNNQESDVPMVPTQPVVPIKSKPLEETVDIQKEKNEDEIKKQSRPNMLEELNNVKLRPISKEPRKEIKPKDEIIDSNAQLKKLLSEEIRKRRENLTKYDVNQDNSDW
jgi:hypothetical protein